MRGVVWIVLLFAAAVVAATALGRNDGLVTVAWGAWRTDLSLNLFVLLLVAGCALTVFALQAINSLISLPRRAQEWRWLRRERAAQAALRESLVDWLNWLAKDVGVVGWRFDFVRGYAPEYCKE